MTEAEGESSWEETKQKEEIRECILFKESKPCDVSDDIEVFILKDGYFSCLWLLSFCLKKFRQKVRLEDLASFCSADLLEEISVLCLQKKKRALISSLRVPNATSLIGTTHAGCQIQLLHHLKQHTK